MNPNAKDILESTTWRTMREELEKQLFERFKAVDPSDTEALTELAYRKRALADIILHFERELKARINLPRS